MQQYYMQNIRLDLHKDDKVVGMKNILFLIILNQKHVQA